ncbi:hypothetical protein K3495_g15470 [Podosphaera aphanis]|nr:hypothetical protein K3495_g15470 [Podosphaera aphanis]
MRVIKDKKVWLEAISCGSLPVIPELNLPIKEIAYLTYSFWHQALCHSAPSTISKTDKLIQDSNNIPDCPKDFHSEACALSKSTHSKLHAATSRSITPGEYLHSDLCGPFPILSLCNSRYYISFINDATCYSWVHLLKSKSDAIQGTIHMITKIETQNNCRVKSLRTDNRGDYINEKLSKYLEQRGINHDLTPPYSPESNGVAERINRSIGESIRAMLSSTTNKRLWAEAVETFIYTKNRIAHGSVSGRTPFEAFNGVKPTIKHLQPFGRA